MKKRKAKTVDQGRPAISVETDGPVGPAALRDLGLWCLLKEKLREVVPKRRVFAVQGVQNIQRWLFVYVPTLSSADLRNLEAATQQFGEPLTVVPERSLFQLEAPLTGFGRCRLSQSGRKEYLHEGDKLELSDLVHDVNLLNVMGYPQKGIRLDAHPGSGRAFSLDCEMSLAGTKRVLTRIAVVDFDSEEVLLDTLVKPAEHVTDYVTQFSGITPEMLEGVTTDLGEIQAWLREHVGTSDILVGHSLESDLSVLEIVHQRCVDTALAFPHHKGLPMRSSLKYLAKNFLDLDIQGPSTPEKPGHDPIEDSLTCVKLIKKKLEHGFSYGNTSKTVPFTTILSKHNLKSTIVGQDVPYWDADGTAHVIPVASGAENVAKTLKALETNDFVFTTLKETDLKWMGTSLSTLATDAPPSTLIMIWNGMSDLTEVRELLAKRKRTREEYRTKKWDEIKDPWTDADDKRLASADESARSGIAFISLSTGGDPRIDGVVSKA